MNRQSIPSLRRQAGGIFDFLIGSGDEETEEESSFAKTSRGTTDQRQTGTVRDAKDGSASSTVQALRSDVQNALNSFLITQLNNAVDPTKTNSDDIAGIAQIMAERSLTAEADVKQNNEAIVANARRQGERQVGRLQTDLAQQAGGSTGNSFVAGATAEGLAGLETSLAGLTSELDTSARNIQATEMAAAIEALRAGTADEATRTAAITTLTEALKGAKTTEKGKTRERDTRRLNLRNRGTVSETSSGTGTGTSSTGEDNGLFGSLIDEVRGFVPNARR